VQKAGMVREMQGGSRHRAKVVTWHGLEGMMSCSNGRTWHMGMGIVRGELAVSYI
jgi:hypothetical protein